jgi:hypothetical protein
VKRRRLGLASSAEGRLNAAELPSYPSNRNAALAFWIYVKSYRAVRIVLVASGEF